MEIGSIKSRNIIWPILRDRLGSFDRMEAMRLEWIRFKSAEEPKEIAAT